MGREASVNHLVQPLVKFPIFVVVLLEFLGPYGGLEVFEFAEKTVEDELPQLLSDKHDQTLRDEGDVMIHNRCSCELHAVFVEAFQLN